jgi:DNA gyrase subunit A
VIKTDENSKVATMAIVEEEKDDESEDSADTSTATNEAPSVSTETQSEE